MRRIGMDLFVYSWYYTGYTVYGHGLNDEGEYALLKIDDYRPSCYVEGERLPNCSVVPWRAEYRRMVTSKDISVKRPFHQVFFKNMKEMEAFVSEVKYNIYMADIPQITIFLSQMDVDHVGWVRADVREKRHDVYDVKASSISGIKDKNPYSSPKVMAFDIEVRSADLGMPRSYRLSDSVEMISVVCFYVGNSTGAKTYVLHTFTELNIGYEEVRYESETELIIGFFELIKKEDPTVLTGFNIFNFDIRYLISRLQLRLLEIPDISRGIKNAVDIIKVDWASDAYGHNKYDRLVIGGRIILDMFLYFKRMKLDKYSLDFISGEFLGEGKNDMHFKDMMEAFRTKDATALASVAKYCVQDSVLVMRLFDKVQMWIDACEISKITRCSVEDIYTRGEQMKMISQCVRECTLRGIVLQPQPRDKYQWPDYEGAYVLEPVKGVYDNCALMDFQSLYPSIIIAHNICPSTYVSLQNSKEHKFLKEPIGMLPGMIKRILEERKAVKLTMKSLDRSSITYVVLDRRQNALKTCANSVYGMMGFKNSRYFGHVGCAESVTSIGRNYLVEVVRKIEYEYPVKVVYGDSVTGYTPTIVRLGEAFVFLETFENLATLWGDDVWIKLDEGKESCELYGVEVWTEDGWTRLHRVIRHTLAPHKRIIRILTHTGLVDVTDEHSLLNIDGQPVNAKYIDVGDELLHHSYPQLLETETSISPGEAMILGMFCGDGSCGTYYCSSGKKTTWAINNADVCLLLKYKELCEEVYNDYDWVIMDTMKSSGVYKLSPRTRAVAPFHTSRQKRKHERVQGGIIIISEYYRSMMYRNKEKTVPQEILNSSFETRRAFWDGLYDADGDKEQYGVMRIDQKHQVTIASFAMLASSLGYSISLNTRVDKPDVFRLTVTMAKQRPSHTSSFGNPQSIKKIQEIEYKGYVYDVTTYNHHFQAGPGKMIVHNTDSCLITNDNIKKCDMIKLGQQICAEITAQLPSPMALMFESYCDKAILLTKKRYVLVSSDKITYKGVMTARRDYCKYAKDLYKGVIGMITAGKHSDEIASYLDIQILKLVLGKCDVSELVITKSISRDLKSYVVNQPQVVLAKRLQDETGVDVPAGTRLEYVFVKEGNNQAEKMRTIEEFKSSSEFTIDGKYYVKKQLVNQIDDILSLIGLEKYIKNNWLSLL